MEHFHLFSISCYFLVSSYLNYSMRDKNVIRNETTIVQWKFFIYFQLFLKTIEKHFHIIVNILTWDICTIYYFQKLIGTMKKGQFFIWDKEAKETWPCKSRVLKFYKKWYFLFTICGGMEGRWVGRERLMKIGRNLNTLLQLKGIKIFPQC